MLAVPPASACTAAQLALSYRDGGFGAGSDFGGIAIRDVSPAACQLTGKVSVTGLVSQPELELVSVRGLDQDSRIGPASAIVHSLATA